LAIALFVASAYGASAMLGSVVPQPGVFYVSNYSAQGAHTDYDLARQAADAWAAANTLGGSVLVLKPTVNQTCDAVPLPSLSSQGTTSIIGYGSGVSSIVKSAACAASSATLSHQDAIGPLSRGLYQGFTVDANHIDLAACELYGMALTTFIDVACGDAAANGDHEAEFGNHDANSVGWMDNIYLYDLKTFDSSATGSGAVLTPVWSGGALAGALTVNPGSSAYSSYARAQIVGPDLYTCSTIPTLTLTLGANSLVSGAVVTAPGSCSSTALLYILVQDGPPVAYSAKFSNMADSHVWGLQATNSTTYGIGWLSGSNNNSIYNEVPSANQVIQITDNANGNRHVNTTFYDLGEFGASITSQNGTFQNPTFEWNSNSFLNASGYYFGNDPRVFHDWMVETSHCNNTTQEFLPVTLRAGPVANGGSLPSGVNLRNIEACDGSNAVYWIAGAP